MNERIKELADQAHVTILTTNGMEDVVDGCYIISPNKLAEFALLIMKESINREELLGAIARGWCSEKNEHKTMDSDLALAIFDEVEKHIKLQFGVEE